MNTNIVRGNSLLSYSSERSLPAAVLYFQRVNSPSSTLIGNRVEPREQQQQRQRTLAQWQPVRKTDGSKRLWSHFVTYLLIVIFFTYCRECPRAMIFNVALPSWRRDGIGVHVCRRLPLNVYERRGTKHIPEIKLGLVMRRRRVKMPTKSLLREPVTPGDGYSR